MRIFDRSITNISGIARNLYCDETYIVYNANNGMWHAVMAKLRR